MKWSTRAQQHHKFAADRGPTCTLCGSLSRSLQITIWSFRSLRSALRSGCSVLALEAVSVCPPPGVSDRCNPPSVGVPAGLPVRLRDDQASDIDPPFRTIGVLCCELDSGEQPSFSVRAVPASTGRNRNREDRLWLRCTSLLRPSMSSGPALTRQKLNRSVRDLRFPSMKNVLDDARRKKSGTTHNTSGRPLGSCIMGNLRFGTIIFLNNPQIPDK